MNSGKKDEDSNSSQTTFEPDSRRLLPGDSRQGLNLFPKPPENRSGVAPSEEKSIIPPEEQGVVVVGPPQVDPLEEERKRNEADERRRKREAHFAALNSRILVPASANAARDSAAYSGSNYQEKGETEKSEVSVTGEYDPAADRDKEQFLQRTESDTWLSPYTRENGHPYEIKTGSVIPGILITAVNSDLPGSVIAQVSQNVFDSATGKYLLIPQGSKLYGAYDSRIVYGQERVLIAWNRVIFPDGTSVSLGAMPGTDMAGQAGFADKVDNHYLRVFGSAVLMSLITGSSAYVMDNAGGSSSNSENGTSMKDEMTAALGAQLGQTTAKLLEKNLNIKPTLEIRQGLRFNITAIKDVIFRTPYAPAGSLTKDLGPNWAPVNVRE
jgi:type IV secretion system protein VirB10